MTTASQTLLLVLRHAHAAKAVSGQDDYSRELDERGRREGKIIHAEIGRRGFDAARILCSGSARTRQTLDLVHRSESNTEIEYSDEIYSGDVSTYLDIVKRQGDARSVMIVGHNPMASELVALLAREGEPRAMRSLAGNFRPASLAAIEFDGALADIRPGTGYLRALLDPNELST
ncbi:SixA phosphatase family protein [Aureimonas psammosilenae]|uniref:SixA phosphatase family protein n=1 Tax=Aureimonas psammosilenae TaxID=2495496 RepID=UPI001260A366|nr:histidine phosphatase family protein [Aureimonas psammosilenae]